MYDMPSSIASTKSLKYAYPTVLPVPNPSQPTYPTVSPVQDRCHQQRHQAHGYDAEGHDEGRVGRRRRWWGAVWVAARRANPVLELIPAVAGSTHGSLTGNGRILGELDARQRNGYLFIQAEGNFQTQCWYLLGVIGYRGRLRAVWRITFPIPKNFASNHNHRMKRLYF